ncbi:MAG: class I SAM-dependent methyltransferase [Isosphaeraceae bacterium]
MPNSLEQCWCLSTDLVPSPHTDYLVCLACGSAKLRAGLEVGQDQVTEEGHHLYGEGYWNEHQLGFGYPTFVQRARDDLAGRAQYWLHHLLKYRLPPGRTLELGCAHGAFVKLLGSVGFDSTGIEMSPSIIAKARSWFGVEVVQGPIGYTDLRGRSYDAILMFDVIEHFADPAGTMTDVLGLLDDEGIVVIQTPAYQGVTHAEWSQFKSPEHTFLFSQEGLKDFFRRMGFNHFASEPALFPDDQFLFASRRPLRVNSPEEIVERLAGSPDGRLVLGMQDLYQGLRALDRMDPADRFGVRALSGALLRSIPRAIARRLRRMQPTPRGGCPSARRARPGSQKAR